jgi:propanol-preferring alcohol dehydrogenase
MLLKRHSPVVDRPLEQTELPRPEPGPGEILVRVTACAICRTDLHVIEGELPDCRLPLIPGHQIVGVVDRCGPECRRFAPGERVGIAWLRRTCGGCEFCIRGQENLCPGSRYTGYHVDGGYAEWAVVSEAFAYACCAPESSAIAP